MLVREGIVSVLEGAGFRVLGQTGDADELLALVDRLTPQVAILGVALRSRLVEDGVEASLRIRAEHPSVAILLLSEHSATRLVPQLLVDAVRRVAGGGLVVERTPHERRTTAVDGLTERQQVVLALIARGRTNRAIAETLHLTPKTVEAHIRSIFAKLHLPQTADDHRRVLAALAYLESRGD